MVASTAWTAWRLHHEAYIRSPEYSLDQLAVALESKNLPLIEKYVNVEATIVSVARLNRQLNSGDSEQWRWVEENPSQVKDQIEQSIASSHTPPFDLARLRKTFTYVQKNRDLTIIGLSLNRWQNTESDRSGIVELCLSNQGAYWQLQGVCNYVPAS